MACDEAPRLERQLGFKLLRLLSPPSSPLSDAAILICLLPILSVKSIPFNVLKFLPIQTPKIHLPSTKSSISITEYPFGLDLGT